MVGVLAGQRFDEMVRTLPPAEPGADGRVRFRRGLVIQEKNMNVAFRLATAFLSICLVSLVAGPSFGMISVGELTKEKANEKYGITMHARKNGDAGIKVWLEFKQEGWLEKFTYAELRMEDARGKHLLSAHLQPNPHHHRQPEDVTTVAFSAEPDTLKKCSFLVVCYGSDEGDVGYFLRVKDFLDAEDPVTEE
jgi:hypothetical protein